METDELREQVIAQADMLLNPSDEALRDIIDRVIADNYRDKYISLDSKILLHKEIYNSIRGFGVLQDLIDDPNVTEIMVNGAKTIFIEEKGKVSRYNGSFENNIRLNDLIQQIVGRVNRRVNEAHPIVDARLEDGSRVNIVLSPIAVDGPVITIRKFPEEKMTIEQLVEMESISDEAGMFLCKLVKAGYNIFVSGGTGSGKTTFLNVLSDFIPEDERVITIEDSAELQMKNIKNLVRLEARQANTEGENIISIRNLIKTSLRMRPDRIIVGEVRGEECIDMLQAMNTGHDGSMSTGHANSTRDILSRLQTMVLMSVDIPLAAVKGQIAAAIDVIVHLGRMRDKSRKVLEISEITGIENGEIKLHTLFKFIDRGDDENGKVTGYLEQTAELMNKEKLVRAGIT